MLNRTQAHVFRLLWFFLPEPAVAKKPQFQHLLAARFLSEAGQQSVVFGSLVAVARGGGSAFEVALVGVAALIPPALFGLYGGDVSDQLPKRVALGGAYSLQALLCFAVPTLFGTDLNVVVLLIFAVNTLGQVSGPAEPSVLPLVASEEELASAASLIGLAAAAGAAFGTALLAPVLVRAFGVRLVFYMAGAMLVLSASRVFNVPAGDKKLVLKLPRSRERWKPAVRWLIGHPAVGTMIIVAVLAGTVNTVLTTLAPSYVVEALGADAADTAYVFAPTVFGLVIALVSAPTIMKIRGERVAALLGLFIAAASLFCLGMVGNVAPLIDHVNPITLVDEIGISLSEKLRTAAFLAIPLAFGVSLTATSVQTYINRRVPLGLQGRTFAMQSTLRNGTAIVPLLTLGGAAALVGPEAVLLASPVLLLIVAYGLVYASFRFAGLAPPSGLAVMESFWEEPERATGGS